jgi:subtilase-type serine protease
MTVSDGGAVVFDYFKVWAPGTLKVQKGGIFSITEKKILNIGTGGHASFEDSMNIGGTLYADGFFSSPQATFTKTGMLSGSGGTITGDVVMNGTLSPGSGTVRKPDTTIGALRIEGDYTHGKEGVYIANIDLKNMTADKLEVTGKATILGGTVNALWKGHVRKAGERVAILTANTSTGSFDTVNGSTALVKVRYDSTAPASVYFTRDAYVTPVTTDNQREVATVLDSLLPVAENNMYDTLAVLDHIMTYGELRSAYEQMTPVIATAYPDITFNALRQVHDAVDYRMSGLRAAPDVLPWSLYAIPIGGVSSHDGDSGSVYPGHDAKTMGIIIGGDKRLGSNFVAGIDGGYTLTNITWKDPGASTGEAGLFFGGVYGGYLASKWNLHARLGIGLASYDTDRRIVFGSGADCIDRTAKSSATGILYSGETGGSYNIALGKWFLRPNASLRYVNLSRDGYTESGAKDIDLATSETQAESLEGSLGVVISRDMTFRGIKVTPELRAVWRHEFMGGDPVILTSSLAAGGSSFVTKGPERGTDRFGLGMGITAEITDRISGFLRFEEMICDTTQAHNFSAGFSLKF